MSELVKTRDHVKGDEGFFFATYLQNNWYSKENTTTLKKDTWMELQHNRLEKILASQKVKVACSGEDLDVILGYAFEDGLEPFVYIRPAFRSDRYRVKIRLLNALEKEKNE